MTEEKLKQCYHKENCAHSQADNGWLPGTLQFFFRCKQNRDGLTGTCRECKKAYARAWYRKNIDTERKRAVERRNANPELARARFRDYYARNREKLLPKMRIRANQWYYDNREYALRRDRAWRSRNPEIVKARVRRYNSLHPEVMRSTSLRRKDRVRGLPNTLSASDWSFALEYFGHTCAICGQPESFWVSLAADHWIPVSDPDCPGTVAWNIVPLCHGMPGIPVGEPCCNQSKFNKDALLWLKERYSEAKAKQISARIEGYFAFVRSRYALI